jgi:hypothetical protein
LPFDHQKNTFFRFSKYCDCGAGGIVKAHQFGGQVIQRLFGRQDCWQGFPAMSLDKGKPLHGTIRRKAEKGKPYINYYPVFCYMVNKSRMCECFSRTSCGGTRFTNYTTLRENHHGIKGRWKVWKTGGFPSLCGDALESQQSGTFHGQ